MRTNLRQLHIYQYTLQGILLGSLPVALLCTDASNPLLKNFLLPDNRMTAVLAAVSTLFMLAGVMLSFRGKTSGRVLALSGILLNIFILFFQLTADPLFCLFYSLTVISAFYYLATGRLIRPKNPDIELQLSKISGAAGALLFMTLLSPLFFYDFPSFSFSCSVSLLILCSMIIRLIHLKGFLRKKFLTGWITTALLLLTVIMLLTQMIILPAFFISVTVLYLAMRLKHAQLTYIDMILRHPARCLLITFLLLSIFGTLLLRTPLAMTGELPLIDTAFTAVSAGCVTGLSVINIAEDLTLSGRIILLLLIQLGGLGIMTLTMLALHALGRLTINQEQLISALADSRGQDIFQNLRLIAVFTLSVESFGAFLLTWGFCAAGENFDSALELGIFTSVSAFCNAGFFPGAANLAPFAGKSLLLTIIAVEIILGGLAPAVTYSVLQKRSWRQLPFISQLVITVSFLLLISGTAGLLLSEWNGIFGELAPADKTVNAFFQAATLRTAGFNTVRLSNMSFPAYLLMLLQMFIGGSPGGTAGGIKTTTLAVMLLTFAAAIKREDQLSVGFRKIPSADIIQAAATVMAAFFILLLTILMLAVTQDIPLKSIVFEAVSALGTVGLTLGATGELDEIGKLIIMAAMFTGRVGPLTLFLLLSNRRSSKAPDYPSINIPMT